MKIVHTFLMAAVVFCNMHAVLNAQDGISEIRILEQARINELQNSGTAGQIRDLQKGLGELYGYFEKFLAAANSAGALYDSMNALDNNECVPELSADASAMMPSSCYYKKDGSEDESSGCSDCYEKANSRLNNVRKNLARMTCIKMNTKNYTDSAIAFGDNVSGIHGAMGLAWQNERKGIKAAYEKFKKTYDGKYVEMMESLEIALKEINGCEAQFGMKDWYQKAGFIYFELMKEKYRRTD